MAWRPLHGLPKEKVRLLYTYRMYNFKTSCVRVWLMMLGEGLRQPLWMFIC